ncbi:MAG: CCDC90 family protein [Bacteroidia bacterium]
MAHAIAFDTLAYAKKLIAAGVPAQQAEVQAEALAEIVEERLSTKQDLKELEVALKRDIKEMELRLKYDITLRFGVMLTAAVAIIAALIKLH